MVGGAGRPGGDARYGLAAGGYLLRVGCWRHRHHPPVSQATGSLGNTTLLLELHPGKGSRKPLIAQQTDGKGVFRQGVRKAPEYRPYH